MQSSEADSLAHIERVVVPNDGSFAPLLQKVETLDGPSRDQELARLVGAFWERAFCQMLSGSGFYTHRYQKYQTVGSARLGKGKERVQDGWALPDILVVKKGVPGLRFYIDVKHKSPTRTKGFGWDSAPFATDLEFANAYPRVPVLLGIHDHGQAPGGKWGTINRIEDWWARDVEWLSDNVRGVGRGPTYAGGSDNGAKHDGKCNYWLGDDFLPLLAAIETLETEAAESLDDAQVLEDPF